jgi:hypothetical protein
MLPRASPFTSLGHQEIAEISVLTFFTVGTEYTSSAASNLYFDVWWQVFHEEDTANELTTATTLATDSAFADSAHATTTSAWCFTYFTV